MKKNKFIIPLMVVLLLSITVLGYNILFEDEGYLQPNDKVTLNSKIVGSDSLGLSKAEATVPQIVKTCDLIVVGEVTSDVKGTKGFDLVSEGSELDAKFKSLYPSAEKPKEYAQYYNFKVDTVLYGDLKSSSFTFSKLVGQTDIAKGQKVLMLLIKDADSNYDDTYCSAALEDGIFTIDDKNYIKSLSNNKYTSAYDGHTNDKLVKDIKKALKDDTIKPLFEKVNIK